MQYVTKEVFDYAVSCRRYLHRHPELGFDLDNTVAFVRGELDKLGISWSEAGPASVTAWIGPAGAKIAVGLRADMDALPVQEKTGLAYASEIPGRMHACGHDAHTAVLLAVAKLLKPMEENLPCRVKLLFQPSEECEISGARSMVDHGAVDDVDFVVCTHTENRLETGKLGYRMGDHMAACNPITITFRGKTAHATRPEEGVDAIAMAVEAYGALKEIAAEEAGKDTVYIFGMNYFHGGTAHNVVSNHCDLKISFRYYDMEFAARVEKRCIEKCHEIAARYGGTADPNWFMSAPPVYNEPALVERFVRRIQEVLPEAAVQLPLSKGTEDFAWFLQKKPGFAFFFGTKNEALGCTGDAHCNDFRIDENAMEYAIEAFAQLVLHGCP